MPFHNHALLGSAALGIQFCDFKDEHPRLCIPSDQADVPASVTFAQDFHGPRIETSRLLRSGTGKSWNSRAFPSKYRIVLNVVARPSSATVSTVSTSPPG
jgi:hypothetical protein